MTQQTPLSTARLEKLQRIMRNAGLDAVALVPGANLVYLTGLPFTEPSSRPLALFVQAQGTPTLLVPVLERPKAEGAHFALHYVSYSDAEGAEVGFERTCTALGLAGKRIGVEGMKMRVLEGQLIQKYAPGGSVESADDSLMWLRMHKDAQELEAMRRAIAQSETALEAVLPHIRPGLTERQIAALLLNALAEAGARENAFEPHVLSGPNTALPHGSTSDRAVREGDLLLFDFGAKVDGYCADITRTFVLGEPSAELAHIYEVVLAANLAGIAAAKPGATGQDVDRAARKTIADAGYGEYFIHRTGHGLGMDVHEPPYMREGYTQPLEPGMVFTIEPGIYVQGLGGVRIEDDVCITSDGSEVLTRYPKSLRRLG